MLFSNDSVNRVVLNNSHYIMREKRVMENVNHQIKQAINHIELFSKSIKPDFIPVYSACSPHSNHSMEVLYSAYQITDYICKANIKGALIEFGVMNGGTLGCMGFALKAHKETRALIGVDTFEGYPAPNSMELDIHGNSMLERYESIQARGESWGRVSIDKVNKFCLEIYPPVKLIKLEVKDDFDPLLMGLAMPFEIAYLRLDMNWYEPTIAALNGCWDFIPKGGVLSVVTGHHNGALKAVDEFFKGRAIYPNFVNVNYSTIVCTKT